MLKKLLCLLCVGILLTGCGQPTKNDATEANVKEKSGVKLSSEESLVMQLKDQDYVVEDGKEQDADMKNYVSWKSAKKDNITCDVFVFKDDRGARAAFEATLDENTEEKNNAVMTVDTTKNDEALGYITKDNLVVRVRIKNGTTNDLGIVFEAFHLTK